jgi:hypothetical protein
VIKAKIKCDVIGRIKINDLAQTLIFGRVGSHFLAAFGSQFSSRSVSFFSRVGSHFLIAKNSL